MTTAPEQAGRPPGNASDDLLPVALQALSDVLSRSVVPQDLPLALAHDARFAGLVADLTMLQQFTLCLAAGDLSPSLKFKGVIAGSLKALQANLRHLTWQTQMVAQGDFSQRVAFMGDFAEAFNTMVERLAKARADLSLANARLRDDIVERDRLIAELDAYAHTVAHDLKNPLGAVLGYADWLTENYSDLAPHEVCESLRRITQGATKMLEIINSLLLLASTRQATVQMEPLNMAAIVAEVCKRLEQEITVRRAAVILPATWLTALGYGPWVEEVWANYLSNALKYGGRPDANPPVPPRVEFGATALAGGSVRFWIRDNGRGLKAEECEQLFVPFNRLNQQRIEGHGLGLSIVQRIVDRLGGQVGVESELGQGSTFSFTLRAYAACDDEAG